MSSNSYFLKSNEKPYKTPSWINTLKIDVWTHSLHLMIFKRKHFIYFPSNNICCFKQMVKLQSYWSYINILYFLSCNFWDAQIINSWQGHTSSSSNSWNLKLYLLLLPYYISVINLFPCFPSPIFSIIAQTLIPTWISVKTTLFYYCNKESQKTCCF